MKLGDCLLVGLGSAVGGICRYGLGSALTARFPGSLPVGTLVVNVSGCLFLGALIAWLGTRSESGRLLLAVGFCGGYTTFSTFIFETARLKSAPASANLLLSLSLGLLALWLGTRLGSFLASS